MLNFHLLELLAEAFAEDIVYSELVILEAHDKKQVYYV